jgi:hypothetical protein
MMAPAAFVGPLPHGRGSDVMGYIAEQEAA